MNNYAILAVVLLAGCGSGETGGSPDPVGPGVVPTLASIQERVFTPTCAINGCHGGVNVQAGLRLEKGYSAENLIGVLSTQDPGWVRVAPFDPANSLLLHKLESDTPPYGSRMPFGGPYLPQETIDVIRQWILNGAQES